MPVPPLISQNPLLGFYHFYKSPVTYLEEQFSNYGDTLRFRLPGRLLTGSRDPELFEHIFVRNQKNYNKTFSSEQLGLALGNGLLTNSGKSWLKQRRLIQPVFYKKRTEGLFDKIENIADDFLQKLYNMPSDQSVFIDQEMMKLTSAIVLEILLGEKLNPELDKLSLSISELQSYLVKRIRIPFYRQISAINGEHRSFERKLKSLDATFYKIIASKKRQIHSENNDIISMLLHAEDQDTGEKMSDKQLRDELITFYVAGHETSAYALSWTLYELVRHPDIYLRLKEEARQVVKNEKIGIDGYKELKFTTAVIHESMRLHPPAHFVTRSCLNDDVIRDIEIKKNDNIIFSIIGMHRHPALWNRAHQFIPERFLTPDNSTRNYFHPFGAGPRMCIGNHFAIMEITIILAKIVANLDFKLAPNQKIEAEPLITLKPKNGIQLIKL